MAYALLAETRHLPAAAPGIQALPEPQAIGPSALADTQQSRVSGGITTVRNTPV
jgi:hypothetical protein